MESESPGYDEDVWRADAAERARKFVSPLTPGEVYCPENALMNRDEMSDETFHDVVDFMYELQPEWQHPVGREYLLGVAKSMVQAEGLCDVSLQRYLLKRADFAELVAMLLVVYKSPEEGETLPADFDKRRDEVVGEFFGEGESIEFGAFYEVFETGRTEFVSTYLGTAGGLFSFANDCEPALLEMLDYLLDELLKK